MGRVLTLCVGLLTFGSFWHTSTAAADPILITSGTIAVDDGLVTVALASSMRAFTLAAGGDTSGGTFSPGQLCVGDRNCQPGQLLSLALGLGGSDLNGTATVDGQTYPVGLGSETQGDAFVGLAGSWVAPAFTGATTASIMSPFTFAGRFTYPAVPLTDRPPEFLLGHGIATLHLKWTPEFGSWDFERARYEFQAEPAPVPEPATLLLVGSGLAGMAVARRRRRQAGSGGA
jgi:PEP-CTERM motif